MNQAAQIAQDALTQLDASKIIARTMHYLEVKDPHSREDLSGDDYLTATCYACAKGALVVGYMTRLGDEKLGVFWERKNELEDIFGRENFRLIEACFEGYYGRNIEVGLRYRKTIPDTEVRLRRILGNIVRNDGTFIPEQDLA